MLFRSLAATVLLTGLVTASAVDISPQCQAAITGIVLSPQGQCLNPSGLIGLVTTPPSESIIPAVNSWLVGFCALDPCTNASLASITTTLASECGPEFGLQPNETPQLVQHVQVAFPPIRKIICLKHTTTDTLCVTETLTNIQSVVGTLSFDNAENVAARLTSLGTLPSNVVCTSCVKQSYNILRAELPNAAANATAPLQSQCGPSMVDGQVPSDISQTARGATL